MKWPDVKCAGCSKDWHRGTEPTICIACGNPTCSAECHLHLQDQGICTFYQNFTPLNDVYENLNGFRALLYKSILAAHLGQNVTYASPRFMNAIKHDSDHILIERGFRQYGNPIPAVQELMKVIDPVSVYEHRLCHCTCEKCKVSPHPVYNCLTWCLAENHFQTQHIECWCICSECIQKGSHTLKDCFHICKLKKLDNTKN